MNEDHQSYEQHGHIGVDELKSLALASGAADDIKGESIDPEVFVGHKVIAVVGLKKRKDGNGNENVVRSWEAVE
jgi:hypothetical protein